MKNRNTAIIATLALTAAALVSTIASAAGFSGNFVIPTPARNVNAMTQGTAAAMFATLPVKVTMCTGAVETPVLVGTGPMTAQATGSTYIIRVTLINVDTTRVDVIHTNLSNNGIIQIDLGGGAQRLVFDRTLPNPGSAGSLTGRDGTYIAGVGLWVAQLNWSTPIKVGAAAVQNDVYNKVTLRFSTCFDSGDSFSMNLDTDTLN